MAMAHHCAHWTWYVWQEIAAITGRLRDANAALQSSEAGRKKAEEDLAAATAAAAASGSSKADADKVGGVFPIFLSFRSSR
jgi:hypothetical protein